MPINPDLVKGPNKRTYFDKKRAQELVLCMKDPIYFAENYALIQHPIKGSVPFIPYPFQKNIIRTFADNRWCIALTARQMGKSLHSSTIITYNKTKVKLISLLKLNFREKIVAYLEDLLLKLSK